LRLIPEKLICFPMASTSSLMPPILIGVSMTKKFKLINGTHSPQDPTEDARNIEEARPFANPKNLDKA
jgi:hypothetical protein